MTTYRKDYYDKNREKIAARQKAWRVRNPEKWKAIRERFKAANPDVQVDWLLRAKYGISYTEYKSKLEAQGGACAICEKVGAKRRLGVDHCHSSGKVRGLLCTKCNAALGALNEDPSLFAKAVAYLRKWGAA